MKRAASVKEALCALCRALAASGSYWDPELLRKAKFNRPEATSELWNLLYHLLKLIYPDEDFCSGSTEKESIEHKVTYVKCFLRTQGYGRAALYALHCDGQEGSRELLLAFSWLLCRMKILEVILEKTRMKMGDQVTICLCHNQPFTKAEPSPLCAKRPADVRYLQWLSGKLKICKRTLHAAHEEECAILHKVHSYTRGCHIDQTIGHLSVAETELIRHPGSCNKILKTMEMENCYLEAYLEWKHLETVYWRWMDTVLQCTLEDEQNARPPIVNPSTLSPRGFQPRIHLPDLQMIHKDLLNINHQLHETTARRTVSWQEQSRDLERELSERELCLTIKKIKQELKNKIEQVKCQRFRAEDVHGPLRIIFKDRKDPRVTAHAERCVHAPEVIAFLQREAREMEAEYEQLQDECRRRLDDLTERLDGVICIPSAKS